MGTPLRRCDYPDFCDNTHKVISGNTFCKSPAEKPSEDTLNKLLFPPGVLLTKDGTEQYTSAVGETFTVATLHDDVKLRVCPSIDGKPEALALILPSQEFVPGSDFHAGLFVKHDQKATWTGFFDNQMRHTPYKKYGYHWQRTLRLDGRETHYILAMRNVMVANPHGQITPFDMFVIVTQDFITRNETIGAVVLHSDDTYLVQRKTVRDITDTIPVKDANGTVIGRATIKDKDGGIIATGKITADKITVGKISGGQIISSGGFNPSTININSNSITYRVEEGLANTISPPHSFSTGGFIEPRCPNCGEYESSLAHLSQCVHNTYFPTVSKGPHPHISPRAGDIWIEDASNKQYVWDTNGWQETPPAVPAEPAKPIEEVKHAPRKVARRKITHQ